VRPWAPRWVVAYGLVTAAFLASAARSYHPTHGFTAFIAFPAAAHEEEIPAVRETAHAHTTSGGYDGQFYAQLAVDPLLQDPAIDRAMDSVRYRARRILFSWTAHVLGLGRPRAVLEAYAIQNLITWLALAGVLLHWMPPVDARRFVLWTACLWSHGMLSSVQLALLDGPSVVLVALAALAAERGRPMWAAGVIGVAGLGRETNLLAAAGLAPLLVRTRVSRRVAAACVLLTAAPLALWLDYLRSIYRSGFGTAVDQVGTPFMGLWSKLRLTLGGLTEAPLLESLTLAAILAMVVHASIVIWAFFRKRDAPVPYWAWIALPFVLLLVTTQSVVWEGYPGAFTRVFLPVTVGAGAVLAGEPRAPWWLIAAFSLGVAPGVWFFAVV
jgi:hypothetical protein